MAKREDPEKVAEQRAKAAKKIVEGVAAQDFYDGVGTFHKAGEPVEISEDELNRLKKGGHRLVISKRAFDARQELERIEREEREAAAQELADAEEAANAETATGTSRTSTRKAATKKAATKRASSKRATAAASS